MYHDPTTQISEPKTPSIQPKRKPPDKKARRQITSIRRLFALTAMATAATPETQSFDFDSRPVAIDTAATQSFSQSLQYMTNYKPFDDPLTVTGVGGGASILGKGTINWPILDDRGEAQTIIVNDVYYSPEIPINLLNPIQWAQQNQGYSQGTNGFTTWLKTPRWSMTLKHDPSQPKLPILNTLPDIQTYFIEQFPVAYAMPHTESPANLRTVEHQDQWIKFPSTKEFSKPFLQAPALPSNEKLSDEDLYIHWHNKLGHPTNAQMKRMLKTTSLPRRLKAIIDKPPICQACQFGKQHRRPWRTKAQPSAISPIKRDQLQPGDCIHIDQMESSTPGFMAQYKGWLTRDRYKVATIFVDSATNYTYAHMQRSTSAEETIEAKHTFERKAAQYGVRIKHYHADNGIFAASDFQKEVNTAGQTISFCAVNAHHQNGIAEKRIRDLTDQARSMLLDAQSRWPRIIRPVLWPYAFKYAIDLQNTSSPSNNQDTMSPQSKFAGVDMGFGANRFRHPFGCPVFVLEAKNQSGGSTPRWHHRSRIGVYLGQSPKHSTSVALILNPKSGHVSPQWHIVHDDKFKTVNTTPEDLVGKWEDIITQKGGEFDHNTIREASRLLREFNESPVTQQAATLEPEPSPTNRTSQPDDSVADHTPAMQSPRRSTRLRRQPERFTPTFLAQTTQTVYAFLVNLLPDQTANTDSQQAWLARDEDNPDVFHYGKMIRQPDRNKFELAMQKEIDGHESGNHWEPVPLSSIPKGTKIIPMVWSFRRKRDLVTGTVKSYKARLCVDGSKQVKGEHYWQTFYPVVTWTTIRLLLILALTQKWHTSQLDFVMAFPQAMAEKGLDLYLHVPKGFAYDTQEPMVMKLKKNIYGTKQAPRIWGQCLHQGLIDLGFTQSQVDPCLYFRKSTLLCVYVDDVCVFAPKQKEVDQVLADLKSKQFIVEKEGTVSQYVGVNIKRQDDKILMSQPALTKRILTTLGLMTGEVTKKHKTPATEVLSKNDQQARQEEWHYRSAIGMLNYLAASTRPDIQFAVHQTARFSQDPRRIHEQAVKRIGRYLAQTHDKGLIYRPQMERGIECYADADFAGSWKKSNPLDETSTLSRTGYLVMLFNCPVIWNSKLQATIALSTTEAELISLSHATKDTKFLLHLLTELSSTCTQMKQLRPKMITRLYEDNKAVIEIAEEPKLRPRTKHLAVKLFHFRHEIKTKQMSIHYVRTNDQLADIMTKPLPRVHFESLRDRIMGWL